MIGLESSYGSFWNPYFWHLSHIQLSLHKPWGIDLFLPSMGFVCSFARGHWMVEWRSGLEHATVWCWKNNQKSIMSWVPWKNCMLLYNPWCHDYKVPNLFISILLLKSFVMKIILEKRCMVRLWLVLIYVHSPTELTEANWMNIRSNSSLQGMADGSCGTDRDSCAPDSQVSNAGNATYEGLMIFLTAGWTYIYIYVHICLKSYQKLIQDCKVKEWREKAPMLPEKMGL